jgi:hypothetical protein
VKEIWKPVPFAPYYKASDLGRVKAIARTRSNGRSYSEQILKPRLEANGYYYLSLTTPIGWRRASVHRVIAFTFCYKPPGTYQVNHINGIRTDNHPENLEWCTAGQNIRHAYRVLGYIVWNKGHRKKRRKKICKWCRIPFTPQKTRQVLCSQLCARQRNGSLHKRSQRVKYAQEN